MRNEIKPSTILLAFLFFSKGISASEWNFNDEDFNKTGEVTLKTTSGQEIAINNSQSANAFSISNAPTVINDSNSNGFKNTKPMGIAKTYSTNNNSGSVSRIEHKMTEDCIVANIKASSYYSYSGNRGTSRLIDISIIADGKKHIIYAANPTAGMGDTMVGSWVQNGQIKQFISNGEFGIPEGATLQINQSTQWRCNNQSYPDYRCNANLTLICLITSYE